MYLHITIQLITSNMVTQLIVNGKSINNHFVITDSKGSYFQSYNTIIAHVDNKGKVYVSSDWNISRTTTKYLCKYFVQLGYSFTDSKKIKEGIRDKVIKVIPKIA